MSDVVREVNLRWNHPYGYRSGEWARIAAVVMYEREESSRLCYAIRFVDGETDYVPCEESRYFEIRAAQHAVVEEVK